MKNIKNKSIISVIVCMALVLATFVNPATVHATDGKLDVADYKGERAQSEWLAPTQEGKVFAGWYEDAEYTTPLATNVTSGQAYAKFVDANVLTIKGQLPDTTGIDSEVTDLRLITSVDGFMYQSVGFKVSVGDATIPLTSNTVYESLKGYVNSAEQSYLPGDVFGADANYFVAIKFEGITKDYFAQSISVTPTWTTLDGTEVTGTERAIVLGQTIRKMSSEVLVHDADVSGTEVVVINEAIKAGSTVTVEIVYASLGKDMAVWLIGSNNVEYNVWGYANIHQYPTLTATINEDLPWFKVQVGGIDGQEVGFNYTIEEPVVEEPDVTISDSDANAEEWYIFDEVLPAGTKVTVEFVSATSSTPMAAWLIGSNWAEYTVWGWGDLNTKPVLSITIPEDLAHLKLKVGGMNGNSVSFNYTIEKPIVLNAADSASVTIEEAVPAGSTITVKVVAATDDSTAIWIYSPSAELAVWGWDNPQKCPTITATVTEDLPWFRVQAAGLDGRSVSFLYEITTP